MPTRRTVRVAEVLRKELSACMTQCLELEGKLITISSIELPPDLKQAYVFVSTLNLDLVYSEALKILNHHRREWQSRIGRRLGLKFTPQLIFRFDQSVERGDRVMKILTQLNLNQPLPAGEIPPEFEEEVDNLNNALPDEHRLLTEEDVEEEDEKLKNTRKPPRKK